MSEWLLGLVLFGQVGILISQTILIKRLYLIANTFQNVTKAQQTRLRPPLH